MSLIGSALVGAHFYFDFPGKSAWIIGACLIGLVIIRLFNPALSGLHSIGIGVLFSCAVFYSNPWWAALGIAIATLSIITDLYHDALFLEVSKKYSDQDRSITYYRENIAKLNLTATENNSIVTSLSKRINDLKTKRPYESQILGEFTLRLGYWWGNLDKGNLFFTFNILQGNKDREFADIMAGSGGYAWLLELKRGKPELSNEKDKPLRVLQREGLDKDPEMRALADKCHWIGFGVIEEKTHLTQIHIGKYWKHFIDSQTEWMKSDKFSKLVFVGKEMIGIPIAEFQKYLNFLAKSGKPTSGDDDEIIGAMIFYSDSSGGGIKCWYADDLMSIAHIYERQIEIKRQQKQFEKIQNHIKHRDTPDEGRGYRHRM